MKFLSLILWLGGLCTDADANNANADDADDTDNYAQQTNHDYIGSFGRIPNEPKTFIKCCGKVYFLTNSDRHYHRFLFIIFPVTLSWSN